MEEFEFLAQSKRLKKQLYETLLQNYKDPSVVIEFQFLQDLAVMLEGFLKDFQTDNPMLPFLSDMLESLVRRLLRMFIKSKIVEVAVTAYNLTKID